MHDTPAPRGGIARDAALLVVVLAVAFAWPLHSPPISTHGEAREGLVVRDVARDERWILPLRNGELPSKPPLYHWIAAAGATVVGVGDVSVRLPSALAAGATALAVFAFAAATCGRVAAWLAVGALLGTHRFWVCGSEARVDMLFAACVTLALVAFFRWYVTRAGAARALCYLATSAAVLTKGPAGALLPALVIAAFVARERWRGDPRARLEGFWSSRLAALAVGIDVAWYLLAFAQGGREFLALHVMRENADRFLGKGVFGLHGGRSRLAMVGALATDLLPWNLVLVWAAWRWLRGDREDEAGRFLQVWWLVIVAFFTIAYGKRDVYLLPLYPAIAILVGRALARATTASAPDRVLGIVAAPAAVRRRFPAHAALATIAIAIIVFDLGLLVIGHATREHRARRKSLVPFAHQVAARVPPDVELLAAPDLSTSDLQVLAYRLDRRITRADVARCDAATVAGASPPSRWYVTPADRAGGEVVVASARRGVNVALVRATTACAEARGHDAPAPAPPLDDDDNDDGE